MIQEKMTRIKEEYERQFMAGSLPYLCHVASDLGLWNVFSEYLVNNIDDTMLLQHCKRKSNARWVEGDIEGRIVWLNKHIEILGSNK